MVGWSEGGRQAKELLKCLTQIAFAGSVADHWFPTGEIDEEGKKRFLQIKQIKARFSRMSVYAIGEHHVTAEELQQQQFNFDLEDQIYIRLDPVEVHLQQMQQHRLIDNEYMFSVKPISWRWYELMAGKIYGTLKHKAPHFEVKYSWYIKHHHTLKKFDTLKRVRFQMDRVVQDHLDSGFLTRVEYRKVKEPNQELDFAVLYFLKAGAKDFVCCIQTHISGRRRREISDSVSVTEAEILKKLKIGDLRLDTYEAGAEVPLKAKAAVAGGKFRC